MSSAEPLSLRACLALVRAAAVLVPRTARADWRIEWEAELRHRHAALHSAHALDWSSTMDLLHRASGALTDAAWLRRQFTTDAELLRDVRHGARMLRQSPSFTLAAVAILALGIGGTLSIATLLDTLFFRPLPYADAERIVTVWQKPQGGEREDVAPANFLDWRDRSRSFSGMAAITPHSYDFTGAGDPEVFFGAQVTEGFMDVMGVTPLFGRAFLPDEHARGARRVAMITHTLWQRRFASDAAIVGSTISLDGVPFTVVGVLPPDFRPQLLPRPGELAVWTPKVVQPYERQIRDSAWWNVVARLAPGVGLDDARAEMAAISGTLGREHPTTNGAVGVEVVPLREHLMGDVRQPLIVMLAAVIVVLAIGCANVASLMLARGMQREREFAIRAALGAGRARLVRQLVAESLLLAVTAAVIGVALAHWLLGVIVALAPAGILRLQDAVIDSRMLALTGGLTIATALAFGVLPALQFSRPKQDVMRDRQPTSPRSGARRLLLGAEVALAVVLLTCAGLLLRSFDRLMSVNPGFSSRNTASLQVFIHDRHPTPEKQRAYFRASLERLAALPGVEASGAVSAMPFANANIDIQSPLAVPGQPDVGRDGQAVYVTIATPGYFEAMSIPLREGRRLRADDTDRTARVAVISDSLRRREWPSESPIGKRIRVDWQGQPLEAEVVGVVSQIRHERLDRAARPEVFLALEQVPFGSMTFVVRGPGEPGTLIAAARQAIWTVDPQQPFYQTASVSDLVSASVVRERFSTILLAALAGTALLLSAVGIYGVVSVTTAQRTREIGVRMALGADRSSIRRMVLREGGSVVAAGLACGLLVSLLATRSLRSLLFEVGAIDPITLALVCVVLVGAALLASYVPARRATRVDPVAALRTD